MKKLGVKILLLSGLLGLIGCASVDTQKAESMGGEILVASGFSPLPYFSKHYYKGEQKAKLNAYRALVKQVYHLPLSTGVSVADQVMAYDVFRVYIDLFLREATVHESSIILDQQKVVLTLNLSPRFYQCISTTPEVARQCIQDSGKIPFTRVGYRKVPMTVVDLNCTSSDCAELLSISGFVKDKKPDAAMLDYGLYDRE